MMAMESIAPFLPHFLLMKGAAMQPSMILEERGSARPREPEAFVEVVRRGCSNSPSCSQTGTITRLGCRKRPCDGSIGGDRLDGAVSLVEGALAEHSLRVGEERMSAYRSAYRTFWPFFSLPCR